MGDAGSAKECDAGGYSDLRQEFGVQVGVQGVGSDWEALHTGGSAGLRQASCTPWSHATPGSYWLLAHFYVPWGEGTVYLPGEPANASCGDGAGTKGNVQICLSTLRDHKNMPAVTSRSGAEPQHAGSRLHHWTSSGLKIVIDWWRLQYRLVAHD